jgi:hypothetical protein
VFNLFNRASFGPLVTALINARFGRPTQMMNPDDGRIPGGRGMDVS